MKHDKSLHWTATPNGEFKGKKVAIVGGTGGIGRAFAQRLAALGAQVTVIGRSFRDQNMPGISFVKADLSLMREAARIAEALPAQSFDLVLLTTGVMAGPQREVTSEGLENDLAISYLSRLVVLWGIAGRLAPHADGKKPRVFVWGFPGTNQKANIEDLNSERGYGRMSAHMNTVAGNEALVLDAAERFQGFNTYGMNPGFVKTDIRGKLFGGKNWLYHLVEGLSSVFTKSAEAYAERIIPLLLAPELDQHNGAMFDSKGRAILPSSWLDPVNRQALISRSVELLRARGVSL